MRLVPRALVAFAVALPLALVVSPAGATSGNGRALTAKDAVLTPTATVVTKTLASTQGCQTLLDTGEGDCAVLGGSDLIFTIEPLEAPDPVLIERPWAIRVYAKSAAVADGWDLVLENPDAQTGTFANVTAKTADLTGDGKDDIVFGYRRAGTGEILELDVVVPEADGPVVAAHEILYKGTAVVKKKEIVGYTAIYKRTDGNCCPSFIERQVVGYRDGKLRVVAAKQTPTKRAKVPPGNLG